MLSEREQLALVAIRDNILSARRFTDGLSTTEFLESQMHFYAATRALEIISEAARRLPDSFRERHPQIRWRAIMGAGNVYRHAYDHVEEGFVLDTIREHLPMLLAIVEAEIGDSPAAEAP